MKKYLCLSTLFIAFCLNSCDTNKSAPLAKNNYGTQNINYATHFSNPYDTIGKYHNEALEEIFTEYFKNNTSRSTNEQEVLKKLISAHLIKKPFNSASLPNHEIEKYVTASSRSLNDSLPLGKQQQEIIHELQYIIKYERGSSPQDLITSINKLEKRINESDITEEEKVGLLATTSVAKYSSIYWIKKFEESHKARSLARSVYDPNDPNNPDFDYEKWYAESFSPHAEHVIQSDFFGAIAGALWVVLFSGPIGIGYVAITLIMYGAVSGSISTSICDGVSILWNLIFEDEI